MGLFDRKKSARNKPKESDKYIINDRLKVIFNSRGLVPVIIQHEKTGDVLRLGYLDRWALEMSLNDKKVYLFRRSLKRVEVVGEKDNNEYKISSVKLGRHYRSLLFKVIPAKSKGTDTNFIHSVDLDK